MRAPLLLLFAASAAAQADSGDWPTHRHDPARSGRTTAELPAARLTRIWEQRAAVPPRPAWPGPARWDAFAGLAGLKSMRNYDPVFHPIAVGDAVWFGSSSEDALVCLDAASGEERWRFTADGPLRVAPTWHEGRLYFGADDGAAYCLEAGTGALVWRFDPTAGTKRVLNDGRLISRWPVRSGVVVDDGTAFFAASLLPWQPSYLCAVDAATGTLEGVGARYVHDLGTGWTLEGALALSATRLVAPQGRVAPLRFDRATGAALGSFEGGGGSFCLITDDDRVLHGPGNKAGWITDSAGSGERIASFERGNAVVLSDDSIFLLSDTTLGCLDRGSGLVRWSVPHDAPFAMILAGEHLYLGGDGRVEARRASDGRLVWYAEVEGRAHGLAAAAGRLLVATDVGAIVAFGAGETEFVVPEAEQPPAPVLGLAPPIPDVRDPDLLDRWVFQANALAVDVPVFANQVEGGLPARALGSLDLRQAGEVQAIALDGGSRDVAIAGDFRAARMPEEAFTAEAWVRIDKAQEWGGLLGASQDNGGYEKGWLLGYRKDRFGLAVNGEGGPDRLSWVVADVPFRPGRWHHVAGTYDGLAVSVYLDGELVARSEEQSGPIQYPDAAYYHAGAYRDQDEYFRAAGMLHELRLYGRALSAEEVRGHYQEKRGAFPEAEGLAAEGDAAPEQPEEPTLELERGPELRFLGRGEATITWWTKEPGECALELSAPGGVLGTLRSWRPDRLHVVRTDVLRRNSLYTYRIQQDDRVSAEFECDTHFDPWWSLEGPPLIKGPRMEWSEADEGRGRIGVLLGADPGLAFEFAGPGLIVLVPDRVAARRFRGELKRLGIPACYAHVLPVESDGPLPLPPGFANGVIASPIARGVEDMLERGALDCVRPYGGVAYLPPRLEHYGPSGPGLQPTSTRLAGWTRHERGAPDGAGVWTHMYGTAAGAAFGGEELGGARSTADLELAWLGRPGPRYQSDRQNRKPAPLSVAGRLFLQGLRRVIALDAHNGSILWGLELPELARFNIPRASSNWCADDEHLYLAIADRCHVIDAANGDTLRVHEVEAPEGGDWEWGYVASAGDALLGSAVRAGGHHTRWWGSASWYDAKAGDDAAKVVSDQLFCLAKQSGRVRWRYSNGRILDATLAQQGDSVWFVEARDPATRAIERGRVHEDSLWTDLHLVCLDLRRGTVRWERPAKPLAGTAAFYLLYGEGRLVMLSSQQGVESDPGGGSFGLYVFDAASGESTWRKKLAWEADHHGKHLSRPAIVGGEVVVRPAVFDLATGDAIARPFPEGHQCGIYTAAANALFLRAGELSVWDRETGAASRWTRLRPDCWISTIPACGMLLSPEGGGGCSCGSWIEASMGFVPRAGGG